MPTGDTTDLLVSLPSIADGCLRVCSPSDSTSVVLHPCKLDKIFTKRQSADETGAGLGFPALHSGEAIRVGNALLKRLRWESGPMLGRRETETGI